MAQIWFKLEQKHLPPCLDSRKGPKPFRIGLKRGIVPCAHLSDLVKGYKLILRAFGFAHVVYDANVAMAQIEEDVRFSYNDEDENIINRQRNDWDDNMGENDQKKDQSNTSNSDTLDDVTSKGSKRKRSYGSNSTTTQTNSKPMVPSLQQCHEHLEER